VKTKLFKNFMKAIDFEDLETICLSDEVGNDLALDSQEITELTDAIQSKYSILIPKIDAGTTVEKVINQVLDAVKESASLRGATFAIETQNSVFVNISMSGMMDYIWKYTKWPDILPHVIEVRTLYQDISVQEFYMVIEGIEVIEVRTVRHKVSDTQINFYQPEPPEFLLKHAGIWTFEETAKGTKVTLCHKSEPKYEVFQDKSVGEVNEQTCEWLSQHGSQTLTSWKKSIEANINSL